MTRIDFSKVVSVDRMEGDDPEDTKLLRGLLGEARSYLLGQRWCERIVESYFGLGVGGIVAVFLFRIIPSDEHIDEFVWVVVGDLPSLYITTEDAPNPACASDGYIGAMEAWATAVLRKEPLGGLAPVRVDPTPEMAQQLKSRLEFVDREVLSEHKEDLKEMTRQYRPCP